MKKSIGPRTLIQPNPVLIIYNSAGQDYYALGECLVKAYMVGRKNQIVRNH